MDKDHTLIRRIAHLQLFNYISATHDNADKNRNRYTIDLGGFLSALYIKLH